MHTTAVSYILGRQWVFLMTNERQINLSYFMACQLVSSKYYIVSCFKG